jgi:hypothetical protein
MKRSKKFVTVKKEEVSVVELTKAEYVDLSAEVCAEIVGPMLANADSEDEIEFIAFISALSAELCANITAKLFDAEASDKDEESEEE